MGKLITHIFNSVSIALVLGIVSYFSYIAKAANDEYLRDKALYQQAVENTQNIKDVASIHRQNNPHSARNLESNL